jgi:hypothetical protein
MPDDKDEESLDKPAIIQSEGLSVEIIPLADTIPQNQETENMEVHHHPHVGKKNFKQYFLEFVMIFFAVTMGFFAEGIRESITKHEKEHHLVKMMVEDLTRDLPNLDASIAFDVQMVNGLDTLRLLICDATVKPLPNENYRHMYFLNRVISFMNDNFSETARTRTLLEKTGGFDLIRNQLVSDSIQEFYRSDDEIIWQQNKHTDILYESYQFSQNIFDMRIFNDYIIWETAPLILKSDRQFSLLTTDKNILLLYASKLFVARGSLFLAKEKLQMQKAKAEQLIKLIEKEYHLE